MKRLSIIVIVAMMSAIVCAQMTAPKINFEVKAHNFGEVNEADGPVTVNFKFTNIGTEPLLLKDVKASCGCTTPKWTREPILPNGEGEIAVTYNPLNRPGKFSKTITVTTNTTPAKEYLSIEGKVLPRVKTKEELYPFRLGALLLKKSHVSLYTMTNAQTKSSVIEVINTTKKPVKVELFDLPAHLSIEPTTVAPGMEQAISVQYDASKKNDWGFVTDDIIFVVDGAKASTKVKMSATIVEDFSTMTAKTRASAPKVSLSARKIDFGTVKTGEDVVKQLTITNKGESPLKIHAVKSTSSILKCKSEKSELAKGESTTVEVVLETSRTRGRQYKTVNIITNDPTSPNVTVTLSGTIN